MKNNTKTTKLNDIERKWYIIDAKGIKVGILSSFVADLLMGKHKPYYVPFMNCGDNVVVINASHLKVNPKVVANKLFYKYSGYPGGLKELSLDQFMRKNPSKVLEHSIKGMLPKNKIGREMYSNLYVYNEDTHPHEAQKPEKLTIK